MPRDKESADSAREGKTPESVKNEKPEPVQKKPSFRELMMKLRSR